MRDTPLRQRGGPVSTVETACPLDCPDALQPVGHRPARPGRRSTDPIGNPVTNGFICAKVRRFAERVYGPDRLLYPAIRKGAKGQGRSVA